jgi:plastocyanin
VKPVSKPRARLNRMGLVLLAVFALVVAGCGGDGETAQDGQEAESGQAVLIKGFVFKPSPLEVKTGTEVTWSNEDQILHTVTAGSPGTETGVFNQELPERGAVFSFTFEDPGTYPYFCARHNSMTGTVVVA